MYLILYMAQQQSSRAAQPDIPDIPDIPAGQSNPAQPKLLEGSKKRESASRIFLDRMRKKKPYKSLPPSTENALVDLVDNAIAPVSTSCSHVRILYEFAVFNCCCWYRSLPNISNLQRDIIIFIVNLKLSVLRDE